jgi:enoyl-[acyl-carrier protein] reductase I
LRTLAARSITGFAEMEQVFAKNNPLRRSLEQSEVGDTAAFLASDWSRGTTGTLVFVDAGWHIL